jgi:hypothetical protein
MNQLCCFQQSATRTNRFQQVKRMTPVSSQLLIVNMDSYEYSKDKNNHTE